MLRFGFSRRGLGFALSRYAGLLVRLLAFSCLAFSSCCLPIIVFGHYCMRVFGSFFASLVSLFGFLSLTLFYGFLAQGAIPFCFIFNLVSLIVFFVRCFTSFLPSWGVYFFWGQFLHICPFSFSYFLLFVS